MQPGFSLQYGMPTLYWGGRRSLGILWGPKRDLNYWDAQGAGLVSRQEQTAVQLLASYSDEERFSYYLYSGLFPALGNATRRTYMVRRFHTVVELDDGVPAASWCIITTDRNYVPETDHVIVMKNLIEGEELSFRSVANRFEPNTDPFAGRVPLVNHVVNPYVNGPIAHPRVHNEPERSKIFMEQEALQKRAVEAQERLWERALAADERRHAEALRRSMRWSPDAPAEAPGRPRFLSKGESALLKVRDSIAEAYGIPVSPIDLATLPPNALVHLDGTPFL